MKSKSMLARLTLAAPMAAAITIAACAPETSANAATGGAGDEEIAVVMEMVEAWNDQDWDQVVDLFSEDGVLHSMMIEPITGRDSIRTRINHMGDGLDSIKLNVKNIGVGGDVVFIERVDEFVYKGHEGAVPVAGVIEVEDGKIKVWREYYDRQELLDGMGVNVDFDAEAR